MTETNRFGLWLETRPEPLRFVLRCTAGCVAVAIACVFGTILMCAMALGFLVANGAFF